MAFLYFEPAAVPSLALMIQGSSILSPVKTFTDSLLCSHASLIIFTTLTLPILLQPQCCTFTKLGPLSRLGLGTAVPSSQKLPFSLPPFQGAKSSSSLGSQLRYHFLCMSLWTPKSGHNSSNDITGLCWSDCPWSSSSS